MLKHVVMWKFKDYAEGRSREENLLKAKGLLERLPARIQAIQYFEVGINVIDSATSYDLVLNSSFQDQDALVTYQTHPGHVEVVEFLRKVQVSKVAVDYIV